MRYTLASLALVAAAAAAPQAVTSAIAPSSSPPAGCQTSYNGNFEIETVNVTSSAKRSLEERAQVLVLTLSNSILKDAEGRFGYIASNSQIQFDNPIQAGAIYTAGWSVCSNGSLAIGGTALFKQCLSGGFYNLYLINDAPQCSPIYIQIISTGTTNGPVNQQSDGQPTATPVSQISDGQVQATTAGQPVTQISDGQIQATTAGQPVTQISDGQIQATAGANPVTQISDGQIQATAGRNPVTQISDGQIQATAGANPVTQISDGQIQATAGANPVTQISDGQIQATAGANPVTQISDGQIQGPVTTAKATGTPVIQISDGQIQATIGPSGSSTRAAVAQYTGAAAPVFGGEVFGLAVGALAVALL